MTMRWYTVAMAAGLLVGCKAQIDVKAGAGSTAPAKPTPPANFKPVQVKVDVSEEETAAAKEHKTVTEFSLITIKEDEIDLNSGVNVNFASGSFDILPDSYPLLVEVANALDQNPEIAIRVEGHTDASGDATSNEKLSGERAYAVYDFLLNWGIAEERLDFTGCGPYYPVADNATADGKAANRRVDFVIVRGGTDYCTSLLD